MFIEEGTTPKGPIFRCYLGETERIAGVGDFLDLMASCGSSTIVIEKDRLPEAFFDLKTKVAGEVLQKVSNYRRRLVVLGDFGRVESKALQDFIRESKRTGQVVFVADLESGIGLLR